MSAKSVCITSGKGGVGKTTLIANVAYALASRNKKILIFDGDLGMANVDIMYGAKANGQILDVLRGERSIHEIITPLSSNISLISGGSGVVELNRLNVFERRALVDSVGTLDCLYDYLLIDTAPGISDNVLYLNSAAQLSTVIITPDPASFADSYALIKILNREYKKTNFGIICNQVRDEIEGLSLFNRFSDVVNRFLYVGLDYWGALPTDPLLRKSIQNQRLIMKHEIQSESYKHLSNISMKLEKTLSLSEAKRGLKCFWEQVVGVA